MITTGFHTWIKYRRTAAAAIPNNHSVSTGHISLLTSVYITQRENITTFIGNSSIQREVLESTSVFEASGKKKKKKRQSKFFYRHSKMLFVQTTLLVVLQICWLYSLCRRVKRPLSSKGLTDGESPVLKCVECPFIGITPRSTLDLDLFENYLWYLILISYNYVHLIYTKTVNINNSLTSRHKITPSRLTCH